MKKFLIVLIAALLLLPFLGVKSVSAAVSPPAHFRAVAKGTTITLYWDYTYNGSDKLIFQIYEYDYDAHQWKYKKGIKYPYKKAVFTGASYGKHAFRIRAKIDRMWPLSDSYSDYTHVDYAYVLHMPTYLDVGVSSFTSPVFVGDPYVHLRWKLPDQNATNVFVYRRIHGTSIVSRIGELPKTATSFIDKTAKPNMKYDYWIVFYRKDGSYGDFSRRSTIYVILTYPAPPTDFKANGILNEVYMSWKHTKNCTGYKIYIKKSITQWAKIVELDKNKTSFVTGKLSPGVYIYQVVAFNTTGNSPHSPVVKAYILKQPTGLTATAISPTEVKLTYDPVDSNAKLIRVDKSTDGGNSYHAIGTVLASAPSIYIKHLTPETDYYFRITALRDSNVSFSSDPVHIKTPAEEIVPNEPEDLEATAASPSEVDLSWADNSDNEDGFKIERKEEGGTYSVIATVPTDTTTYKDTSVEEEKTYYYRVKAFNGKGDSAYSNEVQVTTPAQQTVPSAPTNLAASASSCSEVALSWTDNSDNEEHFVVERAKKGGTYSILATLDPDTTEYTDSTVEGGKIYYYRVKAVNGAGDSEYSNEANVSVPECETVPNAPTNLSGTAVSSSEIDLTWNDNSDNEDGFKIERKEEGGTYSEVASLPENTTIYKDTGLSADTTYYYRVKAFNSKGESNYSNEISIKTESAPAEQTVIKLQPDNEMMIVNGVQQEIDPGRGTKPVIIPKWGRTVVPIRAIVEALGGTIEWDGVARKVTIHFNGNTVELWIGNPRARVNGTAKWIDESNHDVKPIIKNGRTMLPLRFVAENLGCKVDWDAATRTITITYTP